MTQNQYLIQRKLNVVDLAKTLGNISESCRRLGVSRQHYYDIKTALKEDGVEGLLEKSRRVPRIRNRVARETEDRILQYGLEYPTHGQTRVSNELLKQGITISPFGVRSVWTRNGMLSTKDWLNRLEKWSAETGFVLTLNQTVLKEFYQTAFRKKLYRTLDEIQVDLDEYMLEYNEKRTNQGKRCKGRTPMETFQAGIELYHQYVHENLLEEKPEIN